MTQPTEMPSGPTVEEQAAVDAEQMALIEQIRAARAPVEEAERAAMRAKVDKANAAQTERRDLIEAVKALTMRVEALEKKNG